MCAFDEMRAKCALIKEWEPALTPQVDELLISINNLETTYSPLASSASPTDPFLLHMETFVMPMLVSLIDQLYTSTVNHTEMVLLAQITHS
jgi:hypothetical protein